MPPKMLVRSAYVKYFLNIKHFISGSCYSFDAALSKTFLFLNILQSVITFSKLTIETLEQGVKYVQS